MKKSSILFLVIILIAVGTATYMWWPNLMFVSDNSPAEESSRAMPVEDYVRLHISELSPREAVLGGRFYVTEVEAHGGAGTVRYEDGHVAYVADFTYTVDESGKVAITTFELR